MASLEISATPATPEIDQGESLEFTVSLTNTGRDPVQVHDPERNRPFLFEFNAVRKDGPTYAFDEIRYWNAIIASSIRPSTAFWVPLNPGETATYRMDVGQWMIEPMAPGQYRVKAHYYVEGESFVSSSKDLVVKAPQVAALSEIELVSQRQMVSVFTSSGPNGTATVMERESAPSYPAVGPAFRRQNIAQEERPDDLATAVELSSIKGFWYAWRKGGRVGAGFGWAQAINYSSPVHDTGFSPAVLAEHGRRKPDGPAAFLVAGLHQGELQLQDLTFRFEANTGPVDPTAPSVPGQGPPQANPEVRRLPLGGSAVPAHLLARYTPGESGENIDLVWTVNDGTAVQVFARHYPATGSGTPQPARLLYTSPEPLAAIAMNPVGNDKPDVVDVLHGPAEDGKEMTFVRVPLFAGEPSALKFPVPVREEKGVTLRPTLWALPAFAVARPVILCKLFDRILCLRPTAGVSGAVELAQDAAAASHLRAHFLHEEDRYGDRLWATWSDPAKGIIRIPIRK